MNQIAPRETSIHSVSVATGSNGSSIAPQNLGEVVRFAEVMCKADIALPKHLRGNAGACMAVAMQALEWQMSPFAVASKSYEVGGRIAYEAQLIAAVVNTRSGIKGRLKYLFQGEGAAMTCTVTGVLDGEECIYTSPTIGSITVKNSPLWKSDPQQQLGYFSARSWARRHCPEVLLGVYDRDEVEQFQGADNARDVTPKPGIMGRLTQAQGAQEGFDAANVTRETDMLASGQNGQNTETSDDAPSSDAGSDTDVPLGVASELPADEAGIEPGEDLDPPSETSSGSEPISGYKRMLMEECIDGMIREAFSDPAEERFTKIERLVGVFLEKENLADEPKFVNLCAETARRIVGNKAEEARARAYLSTKLPAVEASNG